MALGTWTGKLKLAAFLSICAAFGIAIAKGAEKVLLLWNLGAFLDKKHLEQFVYSGSWEADIFRMEQWDPVVDHASAERIRVIGFRTYLRSLDKHDWLAMRSRLGGVPLHSVGWSQFAYREVERYLNWRDEHPGAISPSQAS